MNIAAAFKLEISRVARKEIRAEIESIRKASGQHRSEIARLKKRVATLESALKRAQKGAAKPPHASNVGNGDHKLRFSPARLGSLRSKLGLSASDMGKLLNVSGQSIYHWEQGKSRPRPSQLVSIASVRKIGKREAAECLSKLA